MHRSPARARRFAGVFGWLAVLLVSCVAQAAEPIPIILDTDMLEDVDDVGAVAVLHALADRGEVRILAMGVCVKSPWSPLCLDALNTYFGRPDIPLGVVKGPAHDGQSKYAQAIAQEFPHRLQSADSAPEAAILYRQTLAAQPDSSVVMVSIGQQTNLQRLLESHADQHSGQSGLDLVQAKVRTWVCMGGAFPKGREFNLYSDAPAAGYSIPHWPTPVVFSGFEIGNEIFTGAGLASLDKQSPVRRAYELYNGLHNRQSWDQTAVLYAARGLSGKLADYWDIRNQGRLRVDPDGTDVWQPANGSEQSYLHKKMAPGKIAQAIEQLMLAPPKRSATSDGQAPASR